MNKLIINHWKVVIIVFVITAVISLAVLPFTNTNQDNIIKVYAAVFTVVSIFSTINSTFLSWVLFDKKKPEFIISKHQDRAIGLGEVCATCKVKAIFDITNVGDANSSDTTFIIGPNGVDDHAGVFPKSSTSSIALESFIDKDLKQPYSSEVRLEDLIDISQESKSGFLTIPVSIECRELNVRKFKVFIKKDDNGKYLYINSVRIK